MTANPLGVPHIIDWEGADLQRLIFGITFLIFLTLYFLALRFVWNRWVPWNATTDLIALVVILVIVVPLAGLTASRTLTFVRENYRS